jgi:chemotaxis signal transduction protein
MSRADELREAFDRGFAEAPAGERAAALELLRIELAGEPHAIALADITSIHVDSRITSVPATDAALIGVIAVRGAIVPVYDLRALLGLATTRAARWVVIAKGLAFAFDAFVGHVAVAELSVRGIVEHDGRNYSIIDLAGVVASRLKEQR